MRPDIVIVIIIGFITVAFIVSAIALVGGKVSPKAASGLRVFILMLVVLGAIILISALLSDMLRTASL